jgi:pilus biogenesis lipoprotein CpaD
VTPAIATHAAKAAFARPDQPSPSSPPQALLLGHGTGVRGVVPGPAPRGPDTGKDRLEPSFIIEYPDAGGSGMKASARGAPGTAGRRRPIVALAALMLAACDHYLGSEPRRLDNATAVGLSDPELRHPMHVAPRRETLDIEVPPDADGLSPNQHIEVVRFLERQQHEAKSRLVVFVPQGGARPASIARFLQDIQRHLADADSNYRIIKMTAWQRGLDAVPSIRLAYERPLGIAPTCGDGTEDAARNAQRVADRTSDCASVHNLAVPIDNTREPSPPQPEDPRSSERRAQSSPTYLGSVAKASGEAAPAASPSKGAGMSKQ